MGEQRRKARAAMVTKALLLGYTFEWEPSVCGYEIYLPDGSIYRVRRGGTTSVHNYPALWMAAKKALELAGVQPDATVVR